MLRRAFSSAVNQFYKPAPPRVIPKAKSINSVPLLSRDEVLLRDEERDLTSADAVRETVRKNAMFTWGPSSPYSDAAIVVDKAKGVRFWDKAGKEYLDFNSQAMCSHLGFDNAAVTSAINAQLEQLPYVYPCTGITEIKAKTAALMADYCPGDLNSFFFTGGGAEANESAIRMVRTMTGRTKILARYRGYHGGTSGTMALTGDPRRVTAEPGMPGVVHVVDPYPFYMDWGAADEEELTHRNLQYLHEVMMYENPEKIAGFWLESIVGTNGLLKAPKGYLEGVRALCDQYGILMVCDEVMAGFGRTGRRFGFMHSGEAGDGSDCVIPDLVAMAKGINGAFLPLGGLAMRQHVHDHFLNNPVNVGSTYNGHPVTLASAHAAIREHLRLGTAERAAALEPVMIECMDMLAAKHPSVRCARAVGLFGMVEFQKNTKSGEYAVDFGKPLSEPMAKLKAALYEKGLFTMFRYPGCLFVNPPLVISEEDLRLGYAKIDECLHILDEALEE